MSHLHNGKAAQQSIEAEKGLAAVFPGDSPPGAFGGSPVHHSAQLESSAPAENSASKTMPPRAPSESKVMPGHASLRRGEKPKVNKPPATATAYLEVPITRASLPSAATLREGDALPPPPPGLPPTIKSTRKTAASGESAKPAALSESDESTPSARADVTSKEAAIMVDPKSLSTSTKTWIAAGFSAQPVPLSDNEGNLSGYGSSSSSMGEVETPRDGAPSNQLVLASASQPETSSTGFKLNLVSLQREPSFSKKCAFTAKTRACFLFVSAC
eukprot:6200248-Pleurochrysis_carterae.AAC.1